MKFILLFLLSSLFINIGHSQEKTSLLVMTKTNGYRHGSIDAGVPALWKMAKEENWTITFTEDSTYFTTENLKRHHTIIFLNTTQDIIGDAGQEAFEGYINDGGGFVGIHAAADTEYEWEFYKNMLGAQFKSHPKTQEARIVVNKKDKHPAIAHLSDEWIKVDEWYNFKEALPTYSNVLLELDESSYEGKRMGTTHPIAWYHNYDGGKIFYTGLGHTPKSFENEMYLTHLKEGIKWTAGISSSGVPE